MSDVLFGQAYYLRFDPKLWAAQQPYPPLGTLYAAAYLRSAGYDVALFDAMLASDETEWAGALDRHQPRFAVIYEDSFNYLSKMCLLRMRDAAFAMIEMARLRGCTVIVSSSDAADHPDAYLDLGADYVILGEGELTLRDVLDRLTDRDPAPPERVAGLYFRDADGHLGKTHPRPILRDLDALPFPAWDLVDVDRYRRIWTARHDYHSMNLVTTRGCPYHCNWCAKPIYGQRYTVRSPEHVVAEMAWLKRTYSPDHVSFVDDIFGLKPGWIDRFADEVEREDAAIPFKCLMRVDLIDDETVAGLRRARCQRVWVGAESGSQRILDAMEKGTTVEQIHRAAHLLRAGGIEVAFFLQFGYPGETRDDIERTLQMVRACRPDDIGVSVSYPLPGTTFYERVKEHFGDKQNWVDSDDLAMLYRGPFPTDFYRQLHKVVHKEFRASRSWDRVSHAVRRPAQLRREHVRQGAMMCWHRLTLPFARAELDRLARKPHKGIPALGRALSNEAAARPTPQG